MAANHRWLRYVLCCCAVVVIVFLVIITSNGTSNGQLGYSSNMLRQLLGQGMTTLSADDSTSSSQNTTISSTTNITNGTLILRHLFKSSTQAPAPNDTRNDTMSYLDRPGYIIENDDLCKDNGSHLRVLILVTSAPDHVRHRMAIRYTWRHFAARKDISIGFFLGAVDNDTHQLVLQEESEMYEDIIQSSNLDGYRRLPLKTLSLLRWVDEHCSGAPFVLKTDDDMFINVPELLSFIKDHDGARNTIFGLIAKKWKPVRVPDSKYRMSKEEFPDDVLPDFATGPAYLMTSDIVPRLYFGALDQRFIPLEDVLFTGIVARDLGINKVHSSKFQPSLRISKIDDCKRQTSISLHDVKYEQQFALWSRILDGKQKC